MHHSRRSLPVPKLIHHPKVSLVSSDSIVAWRAEQDTEHVSRQTPELRKAMLRDFSDSLICAPQLGNNKQFL